MTSDEARDLFSDVIEGSVAPESKDAFDRAIADDRELHEEWVAFRAMMRGAAALSIDDENERDAAPSLLPKVQSKLRQRSRGKFYRDRFSEQAGPRSIFTLLVAILIALLLAFAWMATQSMIVIEPPSSTAQ